MSEEFDSAHYWRERYLRRGYSGPGSIGRLGRYKADYINDLVVRREIKSVIELGSGDGKQARLFTFRNYTRLEISGFARWKSRIRCAGRLTWKIRSADYNATTPRDMSMSLDVIYHLVESEAFETYMTRVFDAAKRYVLIYSSDFSCFPSGTHVKHRRYSEWIERRRPDWKLLEAPAHPFPRVEGADCEMTSFASFKLFGKCGVE